MRLESRFGYFITLVLQTQCTGTVSMITEELIVSYAIAVRPRVLTCVCMRRYNNAIVGRCGL